MTIELKPGKREAFLAEFAANVPNVCAEKGCIEYGAAVDLPTDISAQIPLHENVVIILEKWAALDALKAHLAAPHMAEYRPIVKDLIVGSSFQILEPKKVNSRYRQHDLPPIDGTCVVQRGRSAERNNACDHAVRPDITRRKESVMSQLFENRAKRMIKAGKKTAGAWAQLCSPLSAECLARGGFDWILIDMEHAGGDILTLVTQCQAIAASGTEAVPFVRVPWNDLVWIKRILDAGAYGLMIPYVNTKEEAVRALQACKYPPQGIRGIAGSVRAAGYGRDTSGYLKRANDEIFVMLQVETTQAIENLEAIASVPGVDALFIGPMDLSTSMGHLGNPAHPDVQAAIATVEAKAKKLGMPLGTISGSWEQAKALYDRGYQLITLASDSVLVSKVAAETMAKFREVFP